MTLPQRLLDYVTLALLVAVALLVAFVMDDGPSLRARLLSVGDRWTFAAEDVTSTSYGAGGAVTVTSTWETALRLIRDTIGDV